MSTKLTYFDIRGLGECIRYLMKYAGVNFEDVRITFEEWPKLKASMPFGQMPLYEEKGKTATQSLAIARYIAKKAKLVGKNDWEDLEIDAIVDTVNDIRQKISQYYFESNAEYKETLKTTLFKETIPYYFQRLENIAKENSGHMAVGRLTWADFYFAAVISVLNHFAGTDLLKDRPNLQTVKNKVESLPAVKKWIDVRPKTDF
ncbi:glutathione s-transferase [Holotrichia oblita]|uniref:Glutathione s-transferase n=2 Tax=Holotrichia oblita TaxID=644536 RepID=A0ACB9TWF2_HOLOL|nr:glutathione s-transferase [Holotrichia oblita]KAI4470935.1 glutathione s-transferase [Holotrichia oblita]